MTTAHYVQIIWIIAAGFIAAVLTVYDKIAAKAGRHRIPEATLILIGVLGGALFEFIVMQLIRHKTRKPKFMLGLPIIILLQAALLVALNFWVL